MRPGFVYSCALDTSKERGAILIAEVGGLVESWGWDSGEGVGEGVLHLCVQKNNNAAIAVSPMQIFK